MHRMYLTVLPAILGVLVVAGLAYWGQYAHRVPELVLVIAAAASLATLFFTWVNARYVAQRIERLAETERRLHAEPHAGAPRPDELDTIETVVDRLSSAIAAAESGLADKTREAERARDYAALMENVSATVSKRLDEVRLPLHILLDNKFGELNENQEEMLGAARAAADLADSEVVAMRQLAELDRGARTLRYDRILPGDLVRSLVPTLQAVAEKNKAELRVDIEPAVSAIWGDQALLYGALATLLAESIAGGTGGRVDLRLARENGGCVITLRGGGDPPSSVKTALAIRTIIAMGGRVQRHRGAVTIAPGRTTRP